MVQAEENRRERPASVFLPCREFELQRLARFRFSEVELDPADRATSARGEDLDRLGCQQTAVHRNPQAFAREPGGELQAQYPGGRRVGAQPGHGTLSPTEGPAVS